MLIQERRRQIEDEANRILSMSDSQNILGLASYSIKPKIASSSKITKCQVMGPKLWDSWDARGGTYFRCPRCKDRFAGRAAACKHWMEHCGLASTGHTKPEADKEPEEDPRVAEAQALARSAAIARVREVGAQLQPKPRRYEPQPIAAQEEDGPIEEDLGLLRFWADADPPDNSDLSNRMCRKILEGLTEQGKTVEETLVELVPGDTQEVQKRDFFALAASACDAGPDSPGMEQLWTKLLGPSLDGVVAFDEFARRIQEAGER